MNLKTKFRIKMQGLRGRVKRNAGEIAGDRRLQTEGAADETKSNVRRNVEKVRDAFRGRGARRPRN